ncbi:hypothetical protein KEM56_003238 [Ascosphaera pollenicola]|nr:hypothetical protein KEM56_003238 [Ascosphaera pollenicola]
MNAIRQIQRLNKQELEHAVPPEASWHSDYRDSAYIYIGGLPFDLSEGDILTIFSQFGEPVHLDLVRDKETGKSRGFAFLQYEDQRSTDLAVDNLTGATVLGRVLRVDHHRNRQRGEGEGRHREERERERDEEVNEKETGSSRRRHRDQDSPGREKEREHRHASHRHHRDRDHDRGGREREREREHRHRHSSRR